MEQIRNFNKKILFLILLPMFVFFSSSPTLAVTAKSNCVLVKVGAPSPNTQPDTSGCYSSASAYAEKVIQTAKTQLGKPYDLAACHDWASHPPSSGGCSIYDCSGFVGWSWYWGSDKKFSTKGQSCADFGNCCAYYGGMQHITFDSSKYVRFLAADKAQILPGDIVFFGRNSASECPNGPVIYHTGIYEGAKGNCGGTDCFIHDNGQVRENRLSSKNDFIGFSRPILK